MAKLNENAAAELPLNGERLPEPTKKLNRHVVIAQNHMNKRREVLLRNRKVIDEELEGLDAAILALDK